MSDPRNTINQKPQDANYSTISPVADGIYANVEPTTATPRDPIQDSFRNPSSSLLPGQFLQGGSVYESAQEIAPALPPKGIAKKPEPEQKPPQVKVVVERFYNQVRSDPIPAQVSTESLPLAFVVTPQEDSTCNYANETGTENDYSLAAPFNVDPEFGFPPETETDEQVEIAEGAALNSPSSTSTGSAHSDELGEETPPLVPDNRRRPDESQRPQGYVEPVADQPKIYDAKKDLQNNYVEPNQAERKLPPAVPKYNEIDEALVTSDINPPQPPALPDRLPKPPTVHRYVETFSTHDEVARREAELAAKESKRPPVPEGYEQPVEEQPGIYEAKKTQKQPTEFTAPKLPPKPFVYMDGVAEDALLDLLKSLRAEQSPQALEEKFKQFSTQLNEYLKTCGVGDDKILRDDMAEKLLDALLDLAIWVVEEKQNAYLKPLSSLVTELGDKVNLASSLGHKFNDLSDWLVGRRQLLEVEERASQRAQNIQVKSSSSTLQPSDEDSAIQQIDQDQAEIEAEILTRDQQIKELAKVEGRLLIANTKLKQALSVINQQDLQRREALVIGKENLVAQREKLVAQREARVAREKDHLARQQQELLRQQTQVAKVLFHSQQKSGATQQLKARGGSPHTSQHHRSAAQASSASLTKAVQHNQRLIDQQLQQSAAVHHPSVDEAEYLTREQMDQQLAELNAQQDSANETHQAKQTTLGGSRSLPGAMRLPLAKKVLDEPALAALAQGIAEWAVGQSLEVVQAKITLCCERYDFSQTEYGQLNARGSGVTNQDLNRELTRAVLCAMARRAISSQTFDAFLTSYTRATTDLTSTRATENHAKFGERLMRSIDSCVARLDQLSVLKGETQQALLARLVRILGVLQKHIHYFPAETIGSFQTKQQALQAKLDRLPQPAQQVKQRQRANPVAPANQLPANYRVMDGRQGQRRQEQQKKNSCCVLM